MNFKKASLSQLKDLSAEITYLRKELSLSTKEHLVIEKLKLFTDLLIWGDKNDPSFFHFFQQSKCIDHYLQVLQRAGTKESIICSIDCFSKLVINVSQQPLTYLLSSDSTIAMLSVRFKSLVTEVAEYYINFLKTLAQKLSDSNLHLFLNPKCPNMPLAWQTIRFIHHPEALVRSTARNIILNILRLRDHSLTIYLISFPFVVFYSHFVSVMRSNWDRINTLIETEIDCGKFAEHINDYEDLYLYFEDMLQVATEPVRKCILNGFLCEGMGTLLSNLLGKMKSLSIRTILYLFGTILSNTESGFLAELVSIVLFGRFMNDRVVQGCTSVESICSFRKEWNFRTFWDNYEDKIKEHCLNVLNGKEVPKPTIKHQRSRDLTRSTDTGSLFGQSNTKYESEVYKLSLIYGFPRNNTQSPTVVDVFQAVKTQITSNQLTEDGGYRDNSIRSVVLKCLTSQDDTLVILSLKLIMTTMVNRHVSKDVLLFCGLAADDASGEKENLFSKQMLVHAAVQILKAAMEPQVFRIQTVKVAVGMVSKILGCKNNSLPLELYKALMSTYKSSIEEADSYLKKTNPHWEKAIELFEGAEAECNKPETFKITPSDLMFVEKEGASGKEGGCKSTTSVSEQQMHYQFVFFLLLRNLRYQLFSSKRKLSEIGVAGRSNFREKHQAGTEMTLKNLSGDNSFHCKYKDPASNKYSSCIVICHETALTIVEPLHPESGLVVMDSPYKQLIQMTDRSDPRKLITISNDASKNNISLVFEDAKSCYLAKAKLDALKAEVMLQCLSLLNKHLEVCAQDVAVV